MPQPEAGRHKLVLKGRPECKIKQRKGQARHHIAQSKLRLIVEKTPQGDKG